MSDGGRKHAGFSLVEMLVALVIFSVGVMATIEVLGLCLRSTGTSRDYTRAVFLAQELMERTLAEGVLTTGEESDQFGPEFPGAAWTRKIEESETAGLYELQVVVRWQDRGAERTFELTTLTAER
jgi:general secretion pathway protein I